MLGSVDSESQLVTLSLAVLFRACALAALRLTRREGHLKLERGVSKFKFTDSLEGGHAVPTLPGTPPRRDPAESRVKSKKTQTVEFQVASH
eukprot:950821-Rhodomonas_salina.2